MMEPMELATKMKRHISLRTSMILLNAVCALKLSLSAAFRITTLKALCVEGGRADAKSFTTVLTACASWNHKSDRFTSMWSVEFFVTSSFDVFAIFVTRVSVLSHSCPKISRSTAYTLVILPQPFGPYKRRCGNSFDFVASSMVFENSPCRDISSRYRGRYLSHHK